jgi:hypothetical protein
MPQTKSSPSLQIFKPGRHTAMSGQAIEFSESDLQATVAAYDPAKHEAPLVVGHPQLDMPAYGWVKTLQFADGGIDATPAQVNTDFADMVAAGAFKKISAAFFHPTATNNPVPGVYYLRHVGFLGATAPAVKGMRSPQFADGDEGVISFEFADPDQPLETTTVTPEDKAALEAENTRLRAELAQNRADAVNAANVAFCERLVGLPTAAQPVLVQTFNHLDALPQPLEFGEGEARAPLVTQLKALLASLPPMVQAGEAATRERAASDAAAASADDVQFADSATPERLAQHKAIKAHMAEHKTDYPSAARAVLNS